MSHPALQRSRPRRSSQLLVNSAEALVRGCTEENDPSASPPPPPPPPKHDVSLEPSIRKFTQTEVFSQALKKILNGCEGRSGENDYRFPNPSTSSSYQQRQWQAMLDFDEQSLANPFTLEKWTRMFHIPIHMANTVHTRNSSDGEHSNNNYKKLRDEQNRQWAEENVTVGVSLAKKGRYTDAIEHYDRAINIFSRCVNGYVARGAAYANLREYEKAIKDFRNALELDADHVNAKIYLKATLEQFDASRQDIKHKGTGNYQHIRAEESKKRQVSEVEVREDFYQDLKKQKSDMPGKKKKEKRERRRRSHTRSRSSSRVRSHRVKRHRSRWSRSRDASPHSYRDASSRSRSRDETSRTRSPDGRPRSRMRYERRRSRSREERSSTYSPDMRSRSRYQDSDSRSRYDTYSRSRSRDRRYS